VETLVYILPMKRRYFVHNLLFAARVFDTCPAAMYALHESESLNQQGDFQHHATVHHPL